MKKLKDYSQILRIESEVEDNINSEKVELYCEQGHTLILTLEYNGKWVHCNNKVVDFTKPIYCDECVKGRIIKINLLISLEDAKRWS